jgi:hypothetical protein
MSLRTKFLLCLTLVVLVSPGLTKVVQAEQAPPAEAC